MAQYLHNFNDFTGGIADNPTLMFKGQFVDGKNMNIRDNIPLLKLSSEANTTVQFTTTKEIYCAVDNYFFGEDGYIYASNQSGGPVATTSAAGDICGCAKYNGRYIWWEQGATPVMGKIDVTDADDDSNREDEPSYDDTWDHLSGTALTGWNTDRLPQSSYGVSAVHFAGLLFFSNANQVLYLNTSDVVVVGISDLPYDIVALGLHGSRIMIYMENGEILFWDGVSTSWDEALNLGEQIYLVGRQADLAFIVTGTATTNNTLRRQVGYSFEPIKTWVCGFETDYQGTCNSMGIAILDGLAYVPGGGSRDGIYTYGAGFKGAPEAFNFEFGTSPGGYDFSEIHMVYLYRGNIYVSYEDSNGTKGVATLTRNEASGYTTGYVITPAFDGGLRTKKKVIREIELFGNFSDTNKVVITYRKDKLGVNQYTRPYIIANAPSWTALIDTDNLTNGTQQRIFGTSYDVEFYDIQFKIDLSGSGTLSDFIIYYDYIAE